MKQNARSLVWWPGIDSEISLTVEHCSTCQANQRVPEKAPLHTWEWPKRPWSRIHIDHLGPFEGKTILVVVDAHSKWLEALPVASTYSFETIRFLRNLISHFGFPK